MNLIGPKRKKNYSPIAIGDTKGDNELMLKWRAHGPHSDGPLPDTPKVAEIKKSYGIRDDIDIKYLPLAFGGSTISGIFNCSPWTCALEVYHQKTGIKPDVDKEYNAVSKELGHVYERAIAEACGIYMKVNYPEYNVKIRNETRMFRHGELNPDGSFKYPWALVNPDFMMSINGQDGGLEIKRTTRKQKVGIKNTKNWLRGIVPIYYELQCRYYMATMNVPYWVICCSWGLEIDEMAVIIIIRDYEIEENMMEGISQFAYYCENMIEPPINGCNAAILNNYYSKLYGPVKEDAPAVIIPEDYREVIEKALLIDDKIEEKQQELKDAENEREEIYKSLYPLYKNSSYGYFKMDKESVVGIKLVTPKHRDSIDTEKLKSEHPDIYEKYVSNFDTTKFKRDEKRLAEEYTLPGTPFYDEEHKNYFTLSLKEKGVRTK